MKKKLKPVIQQKPFNKEAMLSKLQYVVDKLLAGEIRYSDACAVAEVAKVANQYLALEFAYKKLESEQQESAQIIELKKLA